MKLLPGVDLVGSGWLGFGLSDANDCHVYLVHDGDDAVLVDSGCGGDPAAIVDNIAAAGVDPSTVSRILVTHAHPDHSAGAYELAERLGARVLASAEVAGILRDGDEEAAGLRAARDRGLYPASVRLRPTPATPLADGESVEIGRITLRAVATPGHAAGHLCFLGTSADDGRTVLFSGDLVFTRGRIALQGTPDCDLAQHWASLRRVAALSPTALLPGHETMAFSGAAAHLDLAVAALDRQDVPPPLLP